MVAIRQWVAWIGMAAALGAAVGAHAASPAALCARLGTSDRLRALPAALVPAAMRIFKLGAMPAAEVERSTVFRCFDHRVLLCNFGANLSCGKADARRDLPAASAWCARHPGSSFIPMYLTGHDTIYAWRCEGAHATTGASRLRVDARGFIASHWRRMEMTTGIASAARKMGQ
ncbi:MAG: hypothetical protein HKM03_06255 [Steroidobacteraceae bacterium]|nr:hypothetical protein [Steroidobacteraceae bacterium]